MICTLKGKKVYLIGYTRYGTLIHIKTSKGVNKGYLKSVLEDLKPINPNHNIEEFLKKQQ